MEPSEDSAFVNSAKDIRPLNDAICKSDIESGHEADNSDNLVEEKVPKDPNVVDWDSPDDPANPINWLPARKVAALGLVSLITFLSPFSSTIIAPAIADVMKAFHSTNQTLASFTTSVFLLGYCFGPLVIAPLSELYGRAILYNICNTFFLIFSIACAVANNIGALIVFRFICGIAGSCPLTLGAGSIADMIPLGRRGFAMTCWTVGPVIGPTIGPVAAGYLAQAKGWRWVFWLVSILAVAVWVAIWLLMRDSYPPIILKRKTERLRKETGNEHLRSALDKNIDLKTLSKHSILRPMRMLFLSSIVFLISLYMATIYGYVYLMFTTFPGIFQGQYDFSNGSVGLVYLGMGIGNMIGLVIAGTIPDRLVSFLTKRNGETAQSEYRLPTLGIGALLVPAGLYMYAWTADRKEAWIFPIFGTGPFGCGLFPDICDLSSIMSSDTRINFEQMPCTTYIIDAFTQYAASATAATVVLRSLLGALLPLEGKSMYNALGVGWGTSLLRFIAVGFIPMPFVLWRFGRRIRESKYSQVKF